MQFILVGAMGFLGVLLRYATLNIRYFENHTATLICNIIGCFLIGYIHNNTMLREHLSQLVINAITIGLIGGLTTYSSFILDIIKIFQSSSNLNSIKYFILSILLGIAACMIGIRINEIKVG